MTSLTSWIKDGLFILALSLMLTLCMLLFAVLVRPLIVLAMISVPGVCLISLFRPRVRVWLESLT